MSNATRVRPQRFIRQPLLTAHWTPGEHQPTALALATAGILQSIADRMGKNVATLEKWAQGERGPEKDLQDLFPALKAAGVPRDRAGLILARIAAFYNAAYSDALPTLQELHPRETLADNAENTTQMDCVLAHDNLDAQARYLKDVLADRAVLDTLAARLTRNLQAAGRL